jgi:hypothetical protein
MLLIPQLVPPTLNRAHNTIFSHTSSTLHTNEYFQSSTCKPNLKMVGYRKVHSHLMLSQCQVKSSWHLRWHPMLNWILFHIK